jgi:short-subunit dehydrogenase
MEVRGANVLVTGASSGIGAALAEQLARQGARVGLVARRADRLAEVLGRCRAHVATCRSWTADLSDVDRAEAVALEAWDEWGHVDVLVNNAAIPKRRHVLAVDRDELELVMRTNFVSPVRMASVLLARMLERGAGTIVNVSSLGGRLGIMNESAYSASKFALTGWTEAVALDLYRSPVRIALVTPGAIDTEIWDRPGNDPPGFSGGLTPAAETAADILAFIEGDGFECYTPDLKGVVEFKTSDIEAFQRGTVAMLEQQAPSGAGEGSGA